MPREERSAADIRVGSDVGHDQDRPAALGYDLIRQFSRRGNVVLGLAEHNEIKCACDRGRSMDDLVVAAAIELDEVGATPERSRRGRERRPRRLHRSV